MLRPLFPRPFIFGVLPLGSQLPGFAPGLSAMWSVQPQMQLSLLCWLIMLKQKILTERRLFRTQHEHFLFNHT